MQTPPLFAIQKQTIKDESTLVAVNYTLNQRDLNPLTNLTLYVDSLTVPAETFTLKGKNITIYSRQIHFQGAVGFDTSTDDYTDLVQPINPTTALGGSQRGHNGWDGIHGGATAGSIAQHGREAGNISIYAGAITGAVHIKAKGGKGQQGQDGQNGGPGALGIDGADAVINRHFLVTPNRRGSSWLLVPARPGGNGGRGGNGGNAGIAGNGGAGGSISVKVISSINENVIRYENGGGSPGNPAKPGKGGPGAPPGQGGRIPNTPDRWLNGSHFTNNRQQGARAGDAGTDGKLATPAAHGATGSFKVSSSVNPDSMLVQNTSMLAMLTLTMRDAEMAYISGNLEKAVDYYKWVTDLTSTDAATAVTSGLPLEFAALHRQSRALLNQINQGLDFYANPMNFVPIVALDHYQVTLDGMIQTGINIETVFHTYRDFLNKETKEFTKMEDAVILAKAAIKTYEEIQKNVKQQLLSLPPVINQLADSLAAQHQVLMNANAAFKKAVEAKACSFESMLSLAKTIVNVGKSAFKAWEEPSVGSVVSAFNDLKGLGIDIFTDRLVANPLAISGKHRDVANAWQAINPNGTGEVGDDKRLIVLRDEFDQTMEPFLSMPEAKDYQKQLHDYIGIAQARNAKLLEYTNAVIQYASIIGLRTQKEEEIKRIEAQIATDNVPGLITYVNFLLNLHQDFKSFVLRYLYQEHRAYVYWSNASSHEFVVEKNDFVGLRMLHKRLSAEILNRINHSRNPDQPLHDIKIELRAAGREKQFADFKYTRQLTFNINTEEDYFLGWSNVMLTNFKIYLIGKGLDSDNNYRIRFIHHGSVFVIAPDDEIHEYTHAQVLASFHYKIENGQRSIVGGGSLGGDNTGGNSRRIALSPYATFTILVPHNRNIGVNLDGLERIDIHFEGHAQTPDKLLSKRTLKVEVQ